MSLKNLLIKIIHLLKIYKQKKTPIYGVFFISDG